MSSPAYHTSRFQARDLPVATKSLRPLAEWRVNIEDFQVSEELGFEPTGEGEHLLLRIRKVNRTTQEVQNQLAKLLGVDRKHVGYAGMKDKRGIAIQWFSVNTPETVDFDSATVRVLEQRRHVRKLRRHDCLSNHFEIHVRNVRGECVETDGLQAVPNYFGPQRFGRDGQNLTSAMAWISSNKPPISRFLRSIYLSAIRSHLFNAVLATRVKAGNWNTPICGDVLDVDAPTGPMWGRGRTLVSHMAASIEEATLSDLVSERIALEWVGLSQERRSLVLKPKNLTMSRQEDEVFLSFSLPSGAFATSVLREAFQLADLGGS